MRWFSILERELRRSGEKGVGRKGAGRIGVVLDQGWTKGRTRDGRGDGRGMESTTGTGGAYI